MYIYPVRCARFPPPCRLFLLGFSWFWVVKFMILSYFRGPGAHFWGPGAHFEDFQDFFDFGCAFSAKVASHLDPKSQPSAHFLQCCFSCFFECPLFLIFCDFGCPEAPFWCHFDSIFGALGLWKNSWKCVTIVKFRGLALPDGVFLQASIRNAFWWAVFLDFCDFGVFWGSRLGTFWHQLC